MDATGQKLEDDGSGCGSVGRAVASNSRGLQFESSDWQKLYRMFTVNYIKKTKIKKKRPGMVHFLKKWPM